MGTETDGHRFTIDTKGNCFICLKCDLGSTQYSFQRLSKYLQLDFKNVYNISFPMSSSVSTLENSEIMVSICSHCSVEANKFVKLHKDLELIRKRANTCVGRIRNLMVDAERNPTVLQEYRQRLTVTSNPLQLIHASIAENLRAETIKQCSKLNTTGTAQTQHIPLLLPLSVQPSAPPIHTSTTVHSGSQIEISRVRSTAKTGATVPVGKSTEVVVVDLDDSDDDEDSKEDTTEGVPIIKSVTGASGVTSSSTSGEPHHQYKKNSSLQRPTSKQPPGGTTVEGSPSSSFSALQNFTTDYNFDLREFGIEGEGNNGGDNSLTSPSASCVPPAEEGQEWKIFDDGSCKCNICERVFQRYDSNVMTVHMRIHAGIKPLSCEHCNQMFRSKGNRRIHVLTYHRKELFSQFHYPAVPIEMFQNVIDMVFKNINKVDDVDRPHKCLYCERQFRHRSDVEAHMINVHFNAIGSKLMELQRQGVGGDTSYNSIHTDDPQQVLPTSSTNLNGQLKRKRFPCDTCGKKFRYISILSKHFTNCCTGKKTDEQEPAPGELVQKTAATTYNYVLKWKCGICSSSFGSQSDLKRHKSLKHSTCSKSAPTDAGMAGAGPGTTVYKCPCCAKKFRFYYSQRVHMLTLHRYQVFCKYVPEGTSTAALDDAIQSILENCKVSEGRSHLCKFCNRDFAGSVASILQNHILVNHFQEVVKRLKSAVEEVGQKQKVNTGTRTEDENMANSVKKENENAVEVILPD